MELELTGARWVAASESVLDPHPPEVHVTVGVYLKSQARESNNWKAAHGRSQTLRRRVRDALDLTGLQQTLAHLGTDPSVIRFVRLAPRSLDDDNLRTAFKPARDQVCCWLAGENWIDARANDGKRSGYMFDYGQQRQQKYGIRIELKVKQ